MPQVNLTDVTGQELRQLLDSSRRRGDAALSYRILQEMAARREAPAERRRSKTRRPAEPRHFVVEAAEAPEAPEADDDVPPMPAWRPPALVAAAASPPEAPPAPPPRRRKARPERALAMAAAPAPSVAAEEVAASPAAPPPAPVEADRPLSLHDFDPEPFEDEAGPPTEAGLRFQPIELGVPRKPPQSRFRLFAGVALGVVFGIAVGWLGGWLARDGMSRPAAPAPIQTAALAPQPAPAPPPAAPIAPAIQPGEPAPEAAPDAAAPSPEVSSTPTPAPKAPEAAPIPDGVAMELPAAGTEREAEAEAAKSAGKARPARDRSAPTLAPAVAPAVAKGCAKAPTPADRAICGDPKLRRLQADLRRAYDEALKAHEDRTLLREHQLAWRDERSTVTDPERLARLYEQRIRKLNAATAEAQRLH